jgi:hypothetical protein
MDVTVTPAADGKTWLLTDLLGRDMGCVAETETKVFLIKPAGLAISTMGRITTEKYESLDEALAAIEIHTRGVCRRCSGLDKFGGR